MDSALRGGGVDRGDDGERRGDDSLEPLVLAVVQGRTSGVVAVGLVSTITRETWALYDAIAAERRQGATYAQIMERLGVSHWAVQQACKWSGLSARTFHTAEEAWAADPTRCNRCGILLLHAGPAKAARRVGQEVHYVTLEIRAREGLCAQCTYEEGS